MSDFKKTKAAFIRGDSIPMTNAEYLAQPYTDKAAALLKSLGAGVHHVTIYHDDWCNLTNGRGPCNCNPEVREGMPE